MAGPGKGFSNVGCGSGRRGEGGKPAFPGDADRLGSNYGRSALTRMSDQVEDRPLLALAVALGIGVLIGAAVLDSASRR